MMKIVGFILAGMILGLCDPTTTHAQFEGIVESKNLTVDETDSIQHFVMTIWMGKGVLRIHNSAIGSTPPSTIIYRNDKGYFWILNEEDKTYIEVLQNTKDDQQPSPQGGAKDQKPEIKKTGKSRKILGYQCEQYLVRGTGEVTEIWGTKGLPGVLSGMTSILGTTQTEPGESWTDELTKLGVFPLLANTKVDGKVVEAQEVTKIEKRNLTPDLFELPAGYARERGERGMNERE